MDSIEYDETFLATLVKRDRLTHDCYMFGFQTDSNVKLNPGEHIQFHGVDKEGKPINRNYTPILSEKKYFEMPIKIYPTGELTPQLETMPLSSTVPMQRRLGKLAYEGMGKFIINPKLNNSSKAFRCLLMVCGGTGITPAYSIINQVCHTYKDHTKMYLIYANKTSQDILLQNQLDQFQLKHPKKFQYYNILNEQPNYSGLTGMVSLEVMQQLFPKPSDDILATHCGPSGMNQAVSKLYKEFGLTNIVKF